jgi:uncharacterized protein with HEPN domain
MPSERDLRWLKSIDENITVVERIVGRTDPETFGRDIIARYAATYALLAISEAVRRLSPEFKRRHPVLEWRDIEDAGNAYRHEYHRLDADLLWTTATVEIRALKKVIRGAMGDDSARR